MQPDLVPPAPEPTAPMLLQIAALILAVRTARFEDREFCGAHSPRFMAAIAHSLKAAHTLHRYARDLYPSWFTGDPK